MIKTTIFFEISTVHCMDSFLPGGLKVQKIVGWGRSPKASIQDAKNRFYQYTQGRPFHMALVLVVTRDAHTGRTIHTSIDGDWWTVENYQNGSLKGLEKSLKALGL